FPAARSSAASRISRYLASFRTSISLTRARSRSSPAICGSRSRRRSGAVTKATRANRMRARRTYSTAERLGADDEATLKAMTEEAGRRPPRVVHLDNIEALPGPGTLTWRPVRATLDLHAFGTNASTAEEAGVDVVEPHTE